jgi:ATP-dependent helicase HrpA
LFQTNEDAAASNAKGVESLLLLKFVKDLKFMERHLVLPEEHQRAALYFGGKAAVERSLLEALRIQVFRRDIRTPEEFRACGESVVRALFEKGQILFEAAKKSLEGYQGVRADLYTILKTNLGNKAVEDAAEVVKAELDAIMPGDFAEVYPPERLERLPRYLEALRIRAERAKNNPEKDQRKAAETAPFLKALTEIREKLGSKSSAAARAAVDELRWLVEELKIAVFAPEVGTAHPVSPKRLNEKLREVRARVEAEAPAKAAAGGRGAGKTASKGGPTRGQKPRTPAENAPDRIGHVQVKRSRPRGRRRPQGQGTPTTSGPAPGGEPSAA